MRWTAAIAGMAALTLAGGLASSCAEAAASSCKALSRLSLPHAKIASAMVVPASKGLPAYCKVLGAAHPTRDSDIRFEVAIPEGAAWNGRYLQMGNGGFAGQIPEQYMALGLAAGFAVAGTDDGHQSTEGTDASWALGHPEKIVDYGYRALKETTDAAKAILAAYAGHAPKYSYFAGCSDGGREALMEAQRYPADFDGIVAGDPANNFTHLIVGANAIELALDAPGGFIGPNKLPAIEAAALHACGDQDGVIEDPLACRFDPTVLSCTGPESDRCLTPGQLTTLKSIYGGMTNPKTGARIGWGLEPGGEAEKDGWADWITGTKPHAPQEAAAYGFGSNFFRYFQFQDPHRRFPDASFTSDTAIDAKLVGIVNSTDPDLSAFRKRGGKLIQYHGWADPAIPARESLGYYQSVQAKMGDTGDFYRLFLAPGMLHCGGGAGPNVLPTLSAIVAWVEAGQAPDQLAAIKFKDNDPAAGIERTRAVCAYPSQAEWDGHGDRNKAESWRCVAHAAS